jgi:glycosyltransferase involved in cell wall biosynthesis
VNNTSGSGRRRRIAVLWDALSGYVHAELSALLEAGADVLVFHRTTQADAPFDESEVTRAIDARGWTGEPDEAEIARALDQFEPDAVLVISWHIGAYRRVARSLGGRTLRILCMSNQWRSSPKQWAGRLISPFLIKPTYDAALVTGERAADFAQRIGFPEELLIWGMNTCDYPRFAAVAAARASDVLPRTFFYVGRLVPDKAIDVLAEGYRRYHASAADPWPLIVAGAGPDGHYLDGIPGVKRHGFVQPDDLPALFAKAGCLVLPSRFEPWGVVIHEATAAGLPVVCTRACGASTRLVLDGYNGVVIGKDKPSALASGLCRVSHSTDEHRRAMSDGSRTLALQYSPERWGDNLLRRVDELRTMHGSQQGGILLTTIR